MFCLNDYKCHGFSVRGTWLALVSIVTRQSEDSGFRSWANWGPSVWSLNNLFVSVWVSLGYFGILAQSKDLKVRSSSYFKWPEGPWQSAQCVPCLLPEIIWDWLANLAVSLTVCSV